MADNKTIEGLEFEIKGSVTNADKSIDDFNKRLKSLRKTLSESFDSKKVIGNIEALKKSIKSVDVNNVMKVSRSLNSLNNIKISGTAATNLVRLKEAINNITFTGGNNVRELTEALSQIKEIKIPSSIAKGIEGIVTTVNNIDDKSIERIKAFTDSLKDLKGIDFRGIAPVLSRATKKSESNLVEAIKNAIRGAQTESSPKLNAKVVDKKELKDEEVQVHRLRNALSSLRKTANTLGGKMSNMFKDLSVGKIAGFTNAMNGFFRSMTRIAMYRAIRTFMKELTQGIKEGINNLYQFSSIMGGTFKNTMDDIATSFTYMKNSSGAMVAPLIQQLAPAIDYVVDKLASMMNIVNQVFATLSGASSYTRAVRSTQQYAEAVGQVGQNARDTAKAIKDATIGIDELNIISEKNASTTVGSNSGSQTPNYGAMFETVPIDNQLSDFADKLKEAFKNQDWDGLGKLMGDKVNDIFNSINWKNIGEKLGTGIDGAVKTLYSFLTTIDFRSMSQTLFEGFNSLVGSIDFNKVGRLLVTKFTIIGDFIIGAIKGLDFGLMARSFSDLLIGAFSHISEWIGSIDWRDLATTFYGKLEDMVGDINWSGIASSFWSALGGALGAAFAIIDTLLEQEASRIVSALSGIFLSEDGTMKSGKDIVVGIYTGIKKKLSDIRTWIVTNVWTPFQTAFMNAFGIKNGSSASTETWGSSLVKGIYNGIVEFYEWIKDAVKEIHEMIEEVFSTGDGGEQLDEWAYKYTGKTFSEIERAVEENQKGKGGAVDEFSKTAREALEAWKTENSPKNYYDAQTEAFRGLHNSLNTDGANVATAFGWVGRQAKDNFTSSVNYWNFHGLMSEVAVGASDGIGYFGQGAVQAFANWAGNLIGSFRRRLGINSPSKVFKELGKFTVEGFNDGFEDEGQKTKKVVDNWSDSFTKLSAKFDVDASSLASVDPSEYAQNVRVGAVGTVDMMSKEAMDTVDRMISEKIQPFLDRIANATETQANKDDRPIVAIGDKDVYDSYNRASKLKGYAFARG